MANPTCPDKRHRNSTVVRAGWYGREGQRRQRWWCQPKTGERHRFTETLPRITSGDGQPHACAECQTTLEAWEGQPAPRLYGFTARDVAWALVQAAQGASYRGTAAAVRARAGRELDTERGLDAKGRPRLAPANQHGQIVSDWVDVFAPVIWKAYAPTTWPEAVMVDEDTLKYAVPFKATGLVATAGSTTTGGPRSSACTSTPTAAEPATNASTPTCAAPLASARSARFS